MLHSRTDTRSMKRFVPVLAVVLALLAGVAVAVPAQAAPEEAPGTWSRLADLSSELWAQVLAAVGFGAEVAPGEDGWVAVSEGAGPSISINGFTDGGDEEPLTFGSTNDTLNPEEPPTEEGPSISING